MRIPVVDNLIERFPRTSVVFGAVTVWVVASGIGVALGWQSAHLWLAPLGLVLLAAMLILDSED